MKVCHITTVHPDRYDVRIFEKECASLAKAGYDVTLLVNDDLYDEIKNDVKIVSLHLKFRNRIDRFINAPRKAYKRAIKVDAELYHLHDPELLSLGKKLKNAGKKVVFDSHEFTAVQIRNKAYIPKLLRKPVSIAYRFHEACSLNKFDGLVMPCTYQGKDFFSRVRIPKVIIGNYPVVEKFMDVPREDIDYDKVCYTGRLSGDRGLFNMIRACYLADKKLVLAGNISDDERNKMERMVEYECVEYLGVLTHEETMRESAKCAVGLTLINPSVQYAGADNLSTKVYEYMMMGMPVVISDFPFVRRVIKKYRFGILVHPSDEKEAAEAITKIASDRELARSMGEEGKRAIKEVMNWENDAKKLIMFYEKLGIRTNYKTRGVR